MEDRGHTPWSDPGPHRDRLGELPPEPAAIADALEEFVIHHAVAHQIGVGVPAAAERDRSLRHASRLLATIVARDPRPLTEHRAIRNYLYGTCRDFALLAASALRERGVPARLRAGFAIYFNAGLWMDHWLCEHRSGGAWALLDAQLGPRARDGFRIGFDVADVPRTAWRSASSIWRSVRVGAIDPASCGLPQAGIAGEWWIATAVLRDAAALAGIECLPWDAWGIGRSIADARAVTPEQARLIDRLAEAIEPAPDDRRRAAAVLADLDWVAPSASDLPDAPEP
jgi:hypothetical protein